MKPRALLMSVKLSDRNINAHNMFSSIPCVFYLIYVLEDKIFQWLSGFFQAVLRTDLIFPFSLLSYCASCFY